MPLIAKRTLRTDDPDTVFLRGQVVPVDDLDEKYVDFWEKRRWLVEIKDAQPSLSRLAKRLLDEDGVEYSSEDETSEESEESEEDLSEESEEIEESDEEESEDEESEEEASEEDTDEDYPRATGSGWYLLSNGEKVQGEEKALAAQAELDEEG